MTDIVERLTAKEIALHAGDRLSMNNLLPWLKQNRRLRNEAAEEIERLRAENERLRGALDNLTIAVGMGWDLDGVLENARAALSHSERTE